MTTYKENPSCLALKEWEIAVEALLRGELAFLLRKGGIHEPGNRFLRDAAEFWLFPTYEHQYEFADEGKQLLKEPWAGRSLAARTVRRSKEEAERTGVGVHTPSLIEIRGRVETRAVYEFWTVRSLDALIDLGIWTREFASARLRWKPRQPLVAFHLQAFRLPEPLSMPADQIPKKCYSWIETPFRLADYTGTPVECPSSDALKRLCAELTAAPEETVAREAARVVIDR